MTPLCAHCDRPVDELAPVLDDDGRPVHPLCSDVPF